jgi:hypothetical protein
VQDRQQLQVGEVEDLAIDFKRAQAPFVILSLQRGIGGRDRWYALPIKKINARDFTGRTLVIKTSRDKLSEAPSFACNQ